MARTCRVPNMYGQVDEFTVESVDDDKFAITINHNKSPFPFGAAQASASMLLDRHSVEVILNMINAELNK